MNRTDDKVKPLHRQEKNLDEATTSTTEPIHRAFSWLDRSLRHDVNAEFVTLTRDVSNGVATVLQILYRCYDDRDEGEQTLLGPSDSEHLLFLATANMKMLAAAADARIDAMNDRADNKAKAGGFE
jgi:hypothetical protein